MRRAEVVGAAVATTDVRSTDAVSSSCAISTTVSQVSGNQERMAKKIANQLTSKNRGTVANWRMRVKKVTAAEGEEG